MVEFPPLPQWSGLHALIIHFPIALLLVAPFFIAIGAALKPKRALNFHIAAFVLMVLGTAAVVIAVESGEAAGKLADRTPQISAVLERHEHLAETTRTTFALLTVVFALLLVAPHLLRRGDSRIATTALPLLFLLAYGFGAVLLANTAHHGGRLVHEFGVHSIVAGSGAPVAAPAETEPSGD